jgi:hypothetical protein
LGTIGGALAAVAGTAAWFANEWAFGNPDTLQLRIAVEGPSQARALAAAVAGSAALLIFGSGLIAAFARQHGVTLWLGGQQPMEVPADVVERFLRAAIADVKGVEAARVFVHSAGRGMTRLALELTVSPDADATVVATAIENRVESLLTPSCSIVLGGRPNITIRYGMLPVREGSSRQAA